MTLQEIIADIHALKDDLETYERKYGVLSETFHEAYNSGEEPEDDSWVLDWADWAGVYKIRRRYIGFARGFSRQTGRNHYFAD